ncbi:hypothetical protein I79_013418 [Cricetulus griseus]|uniref:Uncharacterized protein n=1 Tax=Cricetulus griseus TaxID=10029 RepID=G3HRF1_CRIGR|nr:hypothetical protein I79_013418 [Cricetulus griseus]
MGNLHWSHWERDLPATETCKERHSKQKKKHKRKQNRSPGELEGQGARGKKGRVGVDLVGQEQAGRDCKRQGEDEGRKQAEQFGVLPEPWVKKSPPTTRAHLPLSRPTEGDGEQGKQGAACTVEMCPWRIPRGNM